MHQNAETRMIEVNGTSFAYRSFGKKDGMPLLFIQHFTGTMDNWDPSVTDGFAKNFLVILFDNKGIGASNGESPVTIHEMAIDTISFLKALGLNQINVLGFSMGGFIAQQMLLIEPGIINKLILVGTGPKGGHGIADIVYLLTETATMAPDEQKLYMFYEKTSSSEALGLKALVRINLRQDNRDPDTASSGVQAQLKAILSWGELDDFYLDELKQIHTPILIVNGSNDIVVPTINSYVMFQNFPNARLSLYPDSGHGAIFQYPELFTREVIAFLKCD